MPGTWPGTPGSRDPEPETVKTVLLSRSNISLVFLSPSVQRLVAAFVGAESVAGKLGWPGEPEYCNLPAPDKYK